MPTVLDNAGNGPTREQLRKVEAQIQKVLGPLQLRSDFQGTTIDVVIPDLAAEIAERSTYLSAWLAKAAGNILILAHEVAKARDYPDGSPLWEFLRHCRNAAAHGGHFRFLGDEPRHPAFWGAFKITKDLQGTRLMKNHKKAGLLSVGDPIRLLWDIEEACPHMKAEAESGGLEPANGG